MSRRAGFIRKLVVLIAVACLSAGLTTVVIASLLNLQTSPTANYQAIFSDASGIQPGDPVRIAGVEVGRVTGVTLEGLTQAKVTFKVASAQRVDNQTDATIHYENLLGQRNLSLAEGSTPTTGPGCGPRCIPVQRTTPALDLSDLFNGFQPLFQALSPSDVNQLTGNIIAVFQGESSNVSGLVNQAAALTTNLANRQQVIDQVVDNLTGLLHLVGDHDQQLGSLIDNFSTLTTQLAGERSSIGNAIGNTSSMVSSLNGLLGSVEQPLQTSITGLNSALAPIAANGATLSQLLAQLPVTVTAVDKIFQNGTYATAYVCEEFLRTNGPLYFTPQTLQDEFRVVPGLLPLVNNLFQVDLPQRQFGDDSLHSPNCQK